MSQHLLHQEPILLQWGQATHLFRFIIDRLNLNLNTPLPPRSIPAAALGRLLGLCVHVSLSEWDVGKARGTIFWDLRSVRALGSFHHRGG